MKAEESGGMVDSFFEAVYRAVSAIPKGKVATYGQIAALAGRPRAARAVGTALHANPLPGVIPCHRVVNRAGRVAPGFAFGGPGIQRALLEEEGVAFTREGLVNMSACWWDPDRDSSGGGEPSGKI